MDRLSHFLSVLHISYFPYRMTAKYTRTRIYSYIIYSISPKFGPSSVCTKVCKKVVGNVTSRYIYIYILLHLFTLQLN